MNENHKFQQKGDGALRGGRDENDDDKVLTSSYRYNGGSIPPLPPYNNIQQTLVEQNLQLEQMGVRGQQNLLSTMWQEPADVKEKNAAETELQLLLSEKREPTSESPANMNIPIFDPSVVSEQELYDDFCLYQNANNLMNFHLVAPLTPESLSNSPSMPSEPRMALLKSFDSDDEKEHDTNGFFPSYSSIERRPH
jgi:hypothetical protein